VKTFTLSPFTHIERPSIKIFKGGHGQWQLRGEPPILKSDIDVRKAWLAAAWKRFEEEGGIIELPPLKTRRRHYPRADGGGRRGRGECLLAPARRLPGGRRTRFEHAHALGQLAELLA